MDCLLAVLLKVLLKVPDWSDPEVTAEVGWTNTVTWRIDLLLKCQKHVAYSNPVGGSSASIIRSKQTRKKKLNPSLCDDDVA